jgi:hypothetical protein
VWLTVLAAQRRAWWWWAAAGLAYGLGNATRGNVILLLPLVLLLVAWQARRQPLRLTLVAALVAVTFYLPQLPFAIANYRALGRWVGPSSAAGAVLALGNTPEAPPGGRDPEAGAGAMEYPASWAEWMRQEGLPPPQRVTVGAQLWRWVRQEPLAWAELKWRMWLLIWHRSEIPNNVAMTHFGERVRAPLLWLPVLTEFALLGSLGLAGLLLALGRSRRRPLVWYAAGTVVLYAGSIVVFYILARFRLPVLPLLAGFGGYALWRGARAWRTYRRTRRQRPLLLATLVYLACLVFVTVGYDLYRYGAEATVLRLVRPNGVRVALEHVWLVKDHGPLTLGGWLPVPVRDTPQLSKTLRLPDLPGETAAAVRVAVNSQGPADLDLRLNDQPWQRFTVQRGLQWIELRGLTAATAGRFTVQAHCDVPTVWFMVDAQRRYGRSQLVVRDQPAPPGEWVVELHLDKLSAAPPTSPSPPPQEPPHE